MITHFPLYVPVEQSPKEEWTLNHAPIELEDNTFNYLKIFVLLYADGTVILSESSSDLQEVLDLYASYC